MNDDFYPVLAAHVDVKKFPGLSSVYPAAHLFQRLLIVLAAKTFHGDAEILRQIALIGTRPIRNTDDLSLLITELTSFSTLDNILDRQHPFQPPKKLVDQALNRLQRGPAFAHFPDHVRRSIGKILQDFITSSQQGDTVEPSAILIRLSPHIPASGPSTDPPETLHAAMMARESLVPCVSSDSLASASNTVVQFDPPEVAFFTRQDTGRGYTRPDRRDPRNDPRPALRSDFRRDDRPSSRQDLRGPDRPDSRLDESRDFRPAASDARPESSASLEDLQKLMQSLQSQLDKHVRQVRPASSSHSRERAAYVAHNSDSDELAYSALLSDRYAVGPLSYDPRPLGVRTTIDSSESSPNPW
jgi:hypothetical protein